MVVRLSAAVVLGVACRSAAPAAAPKAPEQAAVYEPSRALNGLFHDVQLAGVFPDSKTFVDARPLETPAQITAAYATERSAPGFTLRAFVD
jgi:alpha,alpha-trehalase